MKSTKAQKSNSQIANNYVQNSIQKICKSIQKQEHKLKINKKPDYKAADKSPQKIEFIVQKANIQTRQQKQSESRITQVNRDKQQIDNQSNVTYSQRTNQSKYLNRFVQEQLQVELKQKAKQFISKIRNRKKQIQGKFIYKKMAQEQRKRQQLNKLKIQQQLQKQIRKQMRVLRAQKNIQFYKQKQKLYQRTNSNSPTTKHRDIITRQSMQSRNRNGTLPSIYSSQLQQIKQQPVSRKNTISLDKTVLRKKKRSSTQADIHNQQYYSKRSNQINLFDINKSTRSKYSFRQQKKSKRKFEDQFDQQRQQDKKRYLMTRNKTQDISVYLQKFSNVSQVRNSNVLGINDRKSTNDLIKKRNHKRELAKSHQQLNQKYEQFQQNQRNQRYRKYEQDEQF